MTVSANSADIGFVHRQTDAAHIYFVANTANERRTFDATFRVTASRAERWNALTGEASPTAVRSAAGRAGSTVALDLAPYESTVVVFPTGAARSKPAPAVRAAVVPPPLDISAGWKVTFGPTGTPVDYPTLRSWTDDEATRHFSGVATYEKTIDVPASMLQAGRRVSLDLGEPRPTPVGGPRARFQAWVEAPVRESAVVSVNGRRAGAVWCPPYAVEVTSSLRPGANTIRIEVANLAVNHMTGRAQPDYRLLNLRFGVRFEPQDMDKLQPVPSGLLGPIRLVSLPTAGAPAGRR
jgi:hypothetical protein